MRLLFALLLLATAPLLQAEGTVSALLFMAPNCPDCVYVQQEILPHLQKQYGSQLNLVIIDIATESGEQIYRNTVNELPISSSRRFVPTMIIGHDVMVGSPQIKSYAPALIDLNLQNGGIGLPPITGLGAPPKATNLKAAPTLTP